MILSLYRILIRTEVYILDSVQNRFPSKLESAQLFVACVFPLHVWAIIMFLYEVPAYLRRMPVWNIVGIFAYTQVIALFESILLLAFLIFICIALPRRFFKDKFVSQGVVLFLVTFIFMIPVHYQMRILESLGWNKGLYWALFIMWVIIYLVGLLGSSVLIRRSQKFDRFVLGFVERATVLSVLYLVVDIISLLIVIYRNMV